MVLITLGTMSVVNVDIVAVKKFAEQMKNLDYLADAVVRWMEDERISPMDKLCILGTVDQAVKDKYSLNKKDERHVKDMKFNRYLAYREKVEKYEAPLHMAVAMGI